MADINLIPQSEKQEQAKERAVKNSTIITIILSLMAMILGAYMFYQNDLLKKAIQDRDNNISALRNDIQTMSEVEISARNLDQKYQTLKNIMSTRNNYSILLSEFKKRIPSTIEVETFGLGKDSTVNVSGQGNDYISIAKFINDLSDAKFSTAGNGLGALFKDVSLNSVNLDAQTNKAKFFIVITVDENLLKKQ